MNEKEAIELASKNNFSITDTIKNGSFESFNVIDNSNKHLITCLKRLGEKGKCWYVKGITPMVPEFIGNAMEKAVKFLIENKHRQ